MNRPPLEVADLIRAAGEPSSNESPLARPAMHLKVLAAIAALSHRRARRASRSVYPLRVSWPSLTIPALWGVFSNGEWRAERTCCAGGDALPTLHYDLAFSRASSLSGGRNFPLRRLGGKTASIASSFSLGSARM